MLTPHPTTLLGLACIVGMVACGTKADEDGEGSGYTFDQYCFDVWRVVCTGAVSCGNYASVEECLDAEYYPDQVEYQAECNALAAECPEFAENAAEFRECMVSYISQGPSADHDNCLGDPPSPYCDTWAAVTAENRSCEGWNG